MLKQLHDLLRIERLTQVVDIGANPIDDDAPYKPMLRAGLCTLTGFEPHPEAFARLSRIKSPHETYLPYAVGDGSQKTLHCCRYSGWSSTLKPSAAALAVFPVFAHNAEVIGEVSVSTRRLDDVAEVGDIDFLKIDIQGGELDVFRNAVQRLAQTSVIQTEVSLFPLYDGQPPFGEVDLELRRQGFMFHSFASTKKVAIAPLILNNDPAQAVNQLVEADAIYVRDFRDSRRLSDQQLRHVAFIAHVCYASIDLAYRCILVLQERGAVASDATAQYAKIMHKRPRAAVR